MLDQKSLQILLPTINESFSLYNYFMFDVYTQMQQTINYKGQATVTFSILALIYEIWAFQAKKCWYFGNKGSNKKSALCKKVLECVFKYF